MPAVAPSVLLEYRLQKQINLFAFTNKSPLLFVPIFSVFFRFFPFLLCIFLPLFVYFYWSFARISTSTKMPKEFAVNGEIVNEATNTHTHTYTFPSQSIKKTLKNDEVEARGEQWTSRVFTICKNHFWRPIEFCFTIFGKNFTLTFERYVIELIELCLCAPFVGLNVYYYYCYYGIVWGH